MKQYIKVIVILTIILTIYGVCLFIFSNKRDQSKLPNNPVENHDKKVPTESDLISNIVLSPKTFLMYKNGRWMENNKLDINNVLFNVYVNNESYGDNYLSNADRWYIYDSNKSFKDFDGDILGINGDYSYSVQKFFVSEIAEEDNSVIKSFLDSKSLTYNFDKLITFKYVFDINQDGSRDNIYAVSNAFNEDKDLFNKAFSFVFVSGLNENKVIYERVEELSSLYLICVPQLRNIIDLDNQRNMIVGCTYYSEIGTEHIIYNILNNEFNEVLKTNINNQ